MDCPYCTALRKPQIPGVEFMEVAGWPGYAVGDDGFVYSSKYSSWGSKTIWRRMKSATRSGGHQSLRLSRRDPAATRVCLVHVLVLEAFVGPRPPGMDGCHYDGDPSNNTLANLRWDTRKANAADAIRHGRQPIGEKAGSSKLTEANVMEMRRLHAGGMGGRRLGKLFNVSPSTAKNVVNGTTWKHLPITC